MLIPRNPLFSVAIALFVVGSAFLILPPYRAYCESNYANEYYCAAYESIWTVGTIIQQYNGAITALATIFIGAFTMTIWKINRDQLRHGRRVERAYVKMSHRTPGVMFSSGFTKVEVEIEVRNHGRTPARVTDALLSSMIVPKGRRVPDRPIYKETPDRDIPSAFLVVNDFFIFSGYTTITSEQSAEVRAGNAQLCIVAYVDYIDQFGERHRGGYGRMYYPQPGENNLMFINERGYNYDRVRLPAEGKDWNDEYS